MTNLDGMTVEPQLPPISSYGRLYLVTGGTVLLWLALAALVGCDIAWPRLRPIVILAALIAMTASILTMQMRGHHRQRIALVRLHQEHEAIRMEVGRGLAAVTEALDVLAERVDQVEAVFNYGRLYQEQGSNGNGGGGTVRPLPHAARS